MKSIRCGCVLAFVSIACIAAADLRLPEAAQSGDLATVRSLLASKDAPRADVNAVLADGTTALHWVVRADDLATADALIRAGAKVSVANRRGVTPLDLACENGSADMIRKLLAAGASAKSSQALMLAARTGNPDAVAILLDRGADVNATEASGQTALMWAITENHPDAVHVLLDHGADVNAATPRIDQPPPTVGNLQGIGRAQERKAPVPEGAMTPLLYAARDGRADIARMLIAKGADVNHPEAFGETPLLLAILNGHTELAQFLLEKSGDPNAGDGFGRAPLWSAVDYRNLDAAEASQTNGVIREPVLDLIKGLLDRGANPNVRTLVEPPSRRWMMGFGARQWVSPAGQTPFVRAALAGDVAVMRLLLEHHADPSIPSLAGTTALMAAAGVGWVPRQTYTESKAAQLEAVKLCVESGLDVNAADPKGYTALHGAAYRGLDDIVQYLVEKGAKLDAKDKDGRTPATLAEGAYLAGNPPEKRSSTLALIQKLATATPQ
jgi:ankyrin repeat protein